MMTRHEMQQLGSSRWRAGGLHCQADADFTQPDQHIPCSFIINEIAMRLPPAV